MKTPINQGLFKVSEEDLEHWAELAANLPYSLPKPTEGLSVEAMRLWLERLDVKEMDYIKEQATSLWDFVMLNPKLPLVSFVGLLLERRDEKNGKNS